MSLSSFIFILFSIIVSFLYFVISEKGKKYVLLLASYFFYVSWGYEFLPVLILTTIATYCLALAIDYSINANTKDSFLPKLLLIISIFLTIGELFFFKYINFGILLLNNILRFFGSVKILPSQSIIAPIGISFFTLQSLGYIIDVYRGRSAEKNIINYALFLSWFPQILSGPISSVRDQEK